MLGSKLVQELTIKRHTNYRVTNGLGSKKSLKMDVYLVSASFQHVHYSLLCHECIWQLLFPQPIKEYGQIVMEIQFLYLDLPRQTIRDSSVVNLNRQVATLIETSQLGVWWVRPSAERGMCEQFWLFVLNSFLCYFSRRLYWLWLGDLSEGKF